jgi:hypothetical protein
VLALEDPIEDAEDSNVTEQDDAVELDVAPPLLESEEEMEVDVQSVMDLVRVEVSIGDSASMIAAMVAENDATWFDRSLLNIDGSYGSGKQLSQHVPFITADVWGLGLV